MSWLLSTTPSSTALMVTIWAAFQLLGVKVTVVGEELISPSGKAMVSVTLAVVASLSTKLIVSVAPLSVMVVLPPDWVIVMLAPFTGGAGLMIVPLSTVVTLISVVSPLA